MSLKRGETDWKALGAEVSELVVLKCRMAHERVVLTEGRARWEERGQDEPAPVRIGFCEAEVRKRNLSCAHTMARYTLERALRALRDAGMLDEPRGAWLQQEFREAGLGVQLLDHRKGALETSHARAVERVTAGDGAAQALVDVLAGELRLLAAEHDGCVERLRVVHAAVLERLREVGEG